MRMFYVQGVESSPTRPKCSSLREPSNWPQWAHAFVVAGGATPASRHPRVRSTFGLDVSAVPKRVP